MASETRPHDLVSQTHQRPLQRLISHFTGDAAPTTAFPDPDRDHRWEERPGNIDQILHPGDLVRMGRDASGLARLDIHLTDPAHPVIGYRFEAVTDGPRRSRPYVMRWDGTRWTLKRGTVLENEERDSGEPL